MNKELKACPFCGNPKPYIDSGSVNNDSGCYVKCEWCGAMVFAEYDTVCWGACVNPEELSPEELDAMTINQAVHMWNRRALSR